ncbi:MAG TPA: hypothetical protein PKZ27_02755 [Rhodocyclaceae bacterium]|nr:hypothetical protein [Burkholderiaceae bacterium]HRP74485.1 hypothetical protein [Rhodocyclaceae bacterium]
MPQMISLRKFRLATTKGHVILFQPKTPTFVPDDAVSEAMQNGCVPADETETPFIEDFTRSKVEFQGDVRKSLIFIAVRQVAERNNHKDFDGAAVPRANVVSELLGFEVFPQEIVDIYRQYLQAKQEGIEYPLHPSAPNVQRVIDANSKAELVELANEFGVDPEKAKGLVARDLRKLLLVKFSGIAAGE